MFFKIWKFQILLTSLPVSHLQALIVTLRVYSIGINLDEVQSGEQLCIFALAEFYSFIDLHCFEIRGWIIISEWS